MQRLLKLEKRGSGSGFEGRGGMGGNCGLQKMDLSWNRTAENHEHYVVCSLSCIATFVASNRENPLTAAMCRKQEGQMHH